MSYNEANNRISVEGWEYDVAGNLVRARGMDGSWINFEYDAANRLRVVKRDDGTGLQGFQYGSKYEVDGLRLRDRADEDSV